MRRQTVIFAYKVSLAANPHPIPKTQGEAVALGNTITKIDPGPQYSNGGLMTR